MEELAYELNLEAARLARRDGRRGDGARRRTGRGTSPARSARPRGRPRSRPTSTTPAPATSPSTSSSRRTPRPPAACSTAASTCSSSRRSSTPSTPRRRSSPSRRSSRSSGRRWPVIVSGTITDASGRTLSGQVTEAFWDSIRHVAPLAVGPQLRPRRQGDAALHRRDVADRRLVRLLLPQRRPAQRLRRVRRGARRDRRDHRASSPRPASSTSSAAAAARRPTTSPRSPRAVEGKQRRETHELEPAMRLSGLEPFTHHRGQPLRQRRRAHQHHRLGAVPQPDQGRRLRHRAVASPRSRSRTARRSSTSTWTRA